MRSNNQDGEPNSNPTDAKASRVGFPISSIATTQHRNSRQTPQSTNNDFLNYSVRQLVDVQTCAVTHQPTKPTKDVTQWEGHVDGKDYITQRRRHPHRLTDIMYNGLVPILGSDAERQKGKDPNQLKRYFYINLNCSLFFSLTCY